ncbi:MAG TPA: ABC transporter ATP-binding protein [Methylomirabilota bacterium]
MAALLEVRGLHAQYGWTHVLHGIDFVVEEGGITTILGANGAGKTTTLRAVCGMVRTSGDIRFAGQRITGRATEDVVRLGIAHAPEGRGTFVNLTVEQNLRLGAYVRGGGGSVVQDLERVYAYFPVLAERKRQTGGTLSGGEQQMLAVARALMLRPRLLLLDEPSLGLAPLVVREIFRIVRTINREEHVSVLLVEQNAGLALGLADHAYLMETGRVVMSGPAAELRQNDAIRRAYLGY